MKSKRSLRFVLSLVLFFVTLLAMSPGMARAASDFDGVIIKSSTLTLGNVDRLSTWRSDLAVYSQAHPTDTGLADAVAELGSSDSRWSLFICPPVTCGGGGFGQVVLTPASAHYGFFYDTYGNKHFGASATGHSLIHFRYANYGEMVDAGQGVTVAGTYTNSADGQLYVGIQQYSNTAIMARTVYVNASVDYPTGYEGETVSPAPPATYVAMGDSYSSGEGNPSFEIGTDSDDVNECHRSPRAYPRLLQNNLGPVVFVACAGASTNDVLGITEGDDPRGKWNESAQIDALSEDTEAVTITVGGNDVEFDSYAYACTITLCGPGTFDYNYIMDAINDPDFILSLIETYETILDRAPNARLYVVGYPYLAVEDSEVCGQVDLTGAWAVQSQLNAVIEDAVEYVATVDFNLNIHYINTNRSGSPFAGKHLCSGSESDFNGLVSPVAYSFHPNGSGQQDFVAVLESLL